MKQKDNNPHAHNNQKKRKLFVLGPTYTPLPSAPGFFFDFTRLPSTYSSSTTSPDACLM
jgi:hypothetical protein